MQAAQLRYQVEPTSTMSTSTTKPGTPSKPGPGSLSIAPSNQAILLDKLNRRSTPDSDALVSSDDEGDQNRQDQPQPPSQAQRPTRRASWLNDTTQPIARPRKGSFASSSMSPTTSHPSTPSAEHGAGPWGSHSQASVMGRVPAPAFPWGTGIWSTDRKDAQTRLSEVLPSPTSGMPPGSAGGSFFGTDGSFGQTSPGLRENGPNPQIPFAIPLHPTPKTYRSQSYSVGQMDPDATAAPNMSNSAVLNRSRAPPHSGLQHRPSRPSMLSEMSSDVLGNVKEVEDDDGDSTSESMHSSLHQSVEAKQIEMLTRENAMLRQQQQHQQQYQNTQNTRLRPRASTGASYGMGNGYPSVPEESDYAIDELDEGNDVEGTAPGPTGRRMSEFGLGFSRNPFENRKLESVKKAMWTSSLGFGDQDGQQSRRHSFADLFPQRQPSISSVGESVVHREPSNADAQQRPDYNVGYPENHVNFGGNPGKLSSTRLLFFPAC